MKQVYIRSYYQKRYMELFTQANFPALTLTDNIHDAHIILADPPYVASDIEKANKLEWLQSTYAGCDTLVTQKKQDYRLTNVRGIFGHLMSEYVFGQLLSLTRHLHQYQAQQVEQKWKAISYQSLKNKTMTIVGAGSIGEHLAKTASHFGMRTIGVNRTGKVNPIFDQMVTLDGLPQALEKSNVVVCTLPATKNTENFFSMSTFAHCQQAIFINVGRGNSVNEIDLIKAIEKNHLSHAILDVVKKEPLEANDRLWAHPYVTITPHISAESFPEQVFDVFCQNYQRFSGGEALLYQVNFEEGY